MLIGQINLETYPLLPEDQKNTAFWQAMDRIPLLLDNSALCEEDYILLCAIDGNGHRYRDAMFLCAQECGLYTNREEFEDVMDREAFEMDGSLHFPKRIVETLAVRDTPEFESYIKACNRSCDRSRQQVLEKLNDMLLENGIPTLAALDTLLGSIPEPEMMKYIQVYGVPTEKLWLGDDLWILSPFTAQIAGEDEFRYRDSLPDSEADLQARLDQFDDDYEPARLSHLLIRSVGGERIAVLQSDNFCTYINERFVPLFGGRIPYIRGGADPVLVRTGGRIDRLIMPIRQSKNGVDSEAYQTLLKQFPGPVEDYEGLKHKYWVYKAENGEPIRDCFVLRPEKDPAAVMALSSYAASTDNKTLAMDILRWIGRYQPLTKLQALNVLPVTDYSCGGGELEYVLTDYTEETVELLRQAGFTREEIAGATEEELLMDGCIDLLTLAIDHAGAAAWSRKTGFTMEMGA